jgi:hypothetical protein
VQPRMILALVVRAAMSIGIGIALAQPEGPSLPTEFHKAINVSITGANVERSTVYPVRAGSDDTETVRSGSRDTPPRNSDHGTLVDPG